MQTKTFCLFVIKAMLISGLVAAKRTVNSVPNFSIRPPMLDRGRIHYKTTYACEGNPLHLSCEEDTTIHLVRANYGRFSISICNDGGRLDLSVICMSYRSFLIMSDRCSQKSNCSVVVSSKLFGDPCPGTMKYLEVQYHCVHGGASAATTTRRPPVQSIAIPSMPMMPSNVSLLLPPVLPTTLSPEDDIISIISTESENSAKPESSISSSTQLTQSALISSTVEPRFKPFPDMKSEESEAPQFSFNLPEPKEISPTLPPSTRINTPIRFDTSPSVPAQPPLAPPVSIQKSFQIENLRTYYCPPIFVRSLFWNWTKKGEVADQKCPGGATGFVKWQCGHNPTDGLAEWMPERPDFSECRSLWLDNLEDRLNNEPVIRIANELALMTLTKAMFSEDLQRIAYIVQKTLSHAITSMQSLESFEVWHRHQVLKELLMFIVEAVSNLLDNAQDDAWLDLTVASRKQVASKLLSGLQQSALLLAENTNQDGSFAVAKPNVLISVHVLDTKMPISLQFPTAEDTRSAVEWIRMEDSLFLPAQALLQHSKEGLAKVAFMAYYRIEDLLKPELYSINEITEQMSATIPMANKLQNMTSGSLTINSRVIGASLSNGKSGDHQNIQLSHPITIVLRHIQEENISSPKCVYWNVERNDWLTDGCWLDSTNATHSVCMCSHLTHFALLTDIRPVTVLQSQQNWAKLVVIVGTAVAMLCMVFIATIMCAVSAGNTEVIAIHRNLCITLLIVEMTFLIGIYRTDIPVLCGLTAGSLHFFLLSSLLWTFLESFDLYLNLIDMYESFKSTKRLIWYYMLAYGGPALIIFISILIDPSSYGSQTHCWLRTDNYFVLSFIGPAVGIVLGGLVFVLISCFILVNHSSTSPNLKCIEEAKLELSRNGIKWVASLLFFQCLTWSLALMHISAQAWNVIAVSFAICNISLGVFIVLFCVFNTDNIQHHRVMRALPLMSHCLYEMQCSNSKSNVSVSDSFPSRPVVTQVSATQVAGIVLHSPLQSPLQPQQALSQAEQQFRPQHLNSPQENDSSTIRLDRPSISVPHKDNNLLSKMVAVSGGTTGPILVNPINSMATVNASIGDISAAALTSHNLADYESKLQQLRQNSLSRQPKNRRKIRVHGSNGHLEDATLARYGMSGLQAHINSNIYNQYIEHIYESIDSDSLSSGIYDRKHRTSRRPNVPLAVPVSQINDLYSGANITINPTHSILGDDWSQNSSSSYGPLYDDRPLLIDSQSINNSPNISQPLISQDIHSQRLHNTNLNIYDRNKEELSSFRSNSRHRGSERSGRNVENTWNIYPGGSGANPDLPDVVQDPIDASNNITTVFVDGNISCNKRQNVFSVSDHNNHSTTDRHQVLSGQPKPNTYC